MHPQWCHPSSQSIQQHQRRMTHSSKPTMSSLVTMAVTISVLALVWIMPFPDRKLDTLLDPTLWLALAVMTSIAAISLVGVVLKLKRGRRGPSSPPPSSATLRDPTSHPSPVPSPTSPSRSRA